MEGFTATSYEIRAAAKYESPRLIVHGSVDELTRGGQGGVPESAVAGSFIL